jgi:hypothetical protein
VELYDRSLGRLESQVYEFAIALVSFERSESHGTLLMNQEEFSLDYSSRLATKESCRFDMTLSHWRG